MTPEETSEYTGLLGLVQRLQRELSQLREVVSGLRDENRSLRDEVFALTSKNTALEARNRALEAEIAKGCQPADPPPFVKPNRPAPPEGEKPKRRKRAVNFARRREEPTREEVHRLERCPDCDGPLSEGYEKRRRQVIELPETPVEVTDHVMMGHWCGYCNKEQVAKVSSKELGIVGEHRMGVRLMSWVALLHIEGRMPLATIRTLFSTGYGLSISQGELTEILHTTARQGEGERQEILRAVREAPVVHGDETGWRENGTNGYLWSFSTPKTAEKQLRYFHYIASRGGKVVAQLLGLEGHKELQPGEEIPRLGTFTGTLVADFYGAYNTYLGPIQRCWAHLLRDLHELKRKHPNDPSVFGWSAAIHEVYKRAKEWKPEHPGTRWEERERRVAQHAFERELMRLAEPYLAEPYRAPHPDLEVDLRDAPQHVLAKRIEKHLPELFVFVADPRVPSDNNNAERSLRPSVIARKISGGTRSPRGSETKTALMTLFGTWKLQGENLLEACRRTLLTPKSCLLAPRLFEPLSAPAQSV